MRPSPENWISPEAARPTLNAMIRILISTSTEGFATPHAQLVRRATTGPPACRESQSDAAYSIGMSREFGVSWSDSTVPSASV